MQSINTSYFHKKNQVQLQKGDNFFHNVSWVISENIIPAKVENKDEPTAAASDVSNKFRADLFVDKDLNAVSI